MNLQELKQKNPAELISEAEKLGIENTLVRYVSDLDKCDSLIIPGGESTAISKQIDNNLFRSKLCDFATTYLGMGHIMILSWRKSDSMCFYRWAAGSNGYEQMIADSFINKFDPDVGSYILKIYGSDSVYIVFGLYKLKI